MADTAEAGPDSGTLCMRVKPGSKLHNLVPFAVEHFRTPNYEKISWSSFLGATAKTVSCVESFKQNFFKPQTQTNSDSDVISFTHLYETVKIFYQNRECVDRLAAVCYVLDEPAICITLSKTPFADDVHQEIVDLKSSSSDFLSVPPDHPVTPKPPSRKRLEHMKKRKRVIVEALSEIVSDEDNTAEQLTYQCPRLAGASKAVSNFLKKKNKKRRKDSH